MKSDTWHRIVEWARDREAMAHQRELARRHYWTEESETEDGRGGDVDRRMTMFGSLFIYAVTLIVLGLVFFSCRRAEGAEGSNLQFPAAALVDALAQIESGNNPRAIGRHGEVTEFQFRRDTLAEANQGWSAFNQKGSVQGQRTNPPARLAAAFHLGKLFQQFTIAAGRAPTPPELYAAWNLGFSRFRRNGFSLARCPASTRDAARRFGNLVEANEQCREGVGIPGRSHKPLFAGSIPAPAPKR